MTRAAPPPTESDQHCPIGRFAIVVSRYHADLTDRLLEGALQTLLELGVAGERVAVFHVPGAWELPVATAHCARSGHYEAVMAMGVVIQGETTHDQHINQQVSASSGQIALETGVPVLFGVLTCRNHAQAVDRCGGQHGNKGSECARAAVQMVNLVRKLSQT